MSSGRTPTANGTAAAGAGAPWRAALPGAPSAGGHSLPSSSPLGGAGARLPRGAAADPAGVPQAVFPPAVFPQAVCSQAAAAGPLPGVRALRLSSSNDRQEPRAGDGGNGGEDPQGQGGQDGRGGQDDNPFAPPPEGAPDRPWEPRTPPPPPGGPPRGGPPPGGGQRPPSPWGPRPPEQRPDSEGNGSRGPRWDVTDPVQRRARYALLSGMWAFFFVIFSIPYLALLLGALAVYWGVSALRTRPRPGADATASAPPAAARPTARPQFASAVSGLVSGGLALAMVCGLFALEIVYRDYFECVQDSLTSSARASCDEKIPSWVEQLVGED